MEKKIYWIWLNKISGLGPRKIKSLIDYFKTPKNIWRADRKKLKYIKGIGDKISRRIITSKKDFNAKIELAKIKKLNFKLVTLNDKCYPSLLKEIYDAPPIFYYKGDLKGLQRPSLAVVGTRKCTGYAIRIANKLSARLAELGISVVSGMALGVDTAAHKGAIENGLTYAVLGSGLDYIYPYQNRELYHKISQNGAVISTFPVGEKPAKKNFPCRNRIISGLSMGTIVVEAPEKSGALITADFALQQGREVFAIPGNIDRKESFGSNKLIQRGAKLVQNMDDIISEIKFNFLTGGRNIFKEDIVKLQKLNQLERKVYKLIKKRTIHYDRISAELDLSTGELNKILIELELKGFISKNMSNSFSVVR